MSHTLSSGLLFPGHSALRIGDCSK